jgi:FAD/FMN-containing dehydrogenase
MRAFRNWAGNVRATATRVSARDAGDVARAIRDAAGRGGRVKVVGSGHSWSAIARPEDVWLDVSALREVGPVEGGRVTVGGGARLGDVVEALFSQGYSPKILGSITAQTVAGALATGTHGSSLQHGILAASVRELTLVDGLGDVRTLHDGDAELDAARVALGALGVVTSVTLAVDRAFRLREEVSLVPVDDVAGTLVEIGRSAEYVKVWWLPHTPVAVVFRYTRTEEPVAAPGPWSRSFDERVVNRWLFPALLAAGRAMPPFVDVVNRVVTSLYLKPKITVDRMDRQLTLAMPPVHRESEWSVPLDRGGEAFDRVRRVIRDERLHVGFITELRFVKGDESWMSPAYGGDRVAVGVYTHESSTREGYFRAAREALADLAPRPHWGKEHDGVGPSDVDRAWPRAADFRALTRTFDPGGAFRNAWLDDVVGR